MVPTTIEQKWPLELRLTPEKTELIVLFSDGVCASFSSEFLRVLSPSAEVQGHSPSERKLVAGKRSVLITAIEPVGNYAVRLTFSDGHSTGLYSWQYFYELHEKQQDLWENYVQNLAKAGRSREA